MTKSQHTREPRDQPFPQMILRPHETETNIHINNKKDTQKKHRLGTVSKIILEGLSNSYTMGCQPVRGDNPRALASGLSYVQVDKHGITILYHLHQCRR